MPPVPRDDAYPVLTRLNRTNGTAIFLTAVGLVLAGLLVPGVIGAVILLAVVAGLAWVLSRTWRLAPAGLLAVRVALLAGLVAVAAVKMI